LRDAIELEWAGVPSVCIVHEALTGSAAAIARISGHPDYPFLTVGLPYPPSGEWSDDECRAVARQLAPEVKRLLTTSS